MSPAAMPFDVRRWARGAAEASDSTSKRVSDTSARLDLGADGLPHGAVLGDVRPAVGADADQRRPFGSQRVGDRGGKGARIARCRVAEAEELRDALGVQTGR